MHSFSLMVRYINKHSWIMKILSFKERREKKYITVRQVKSSVTAYYIARSVSVYSDLINFVCFYKSEKTKTFQLLYNAGHKVAKNTHFSAFSNSLILTVCAPSRFITLKKNNVTKMTNSKICHIILKKKLCSQQLY